MKLHVEASKTLPLVSFSVAFKTGAVVDPIGKEGATRVLARMIRRGGAGKTALQIEEAVDLLGGELSADVGPSHVTFSAEVLERNAEALCALVGDLLAKPAFDEIELAKLRRETLAELEEARDNDRLLASRALRRRLFTGHPYGRRLGGTAETIPGIAREDLVVLAATHLTRARAVVGVAGHVDDARAERLASLLVGALPESGPAVIDPPEPQAPRGRTLVFVDKPERTQTQMAIATLGTHAHDADHVPLVVANNAFGGTFTARLMNEVRAKRGWSYGAYSRLGLDRRREAFAMWTAPAQTDAAKCLALELELLSTWVKDGLTDDEVSFSKNHLVKSSVFEVDTPQKRLSQKIETDVYDLPPDHHAAMSARITAVTTPVANEAVRARIAPSDLVIAVVGTKDDVLAELEAALPDRAETVVVPYDE